MQKAWLISRQYSAGCNTFHALFYCTASKVATCLVIKTCLVIFCFLFLFLNSKTIPFSSVCPYDFTLRVGPIISTGLTFTAFCNLNIISWQLPGDLKSWDADKQESLDQITSYYLLLLHHMNTHCLCRSPKEVCICAARSDASCGHIAATWAVVT